ncbi:microtubule-actin cross-linking factor 1 [Biomphalaria glabrata]|nr:microtubule-actin cross-linking factor 1-like [Biomphalaria glabrata]
MEDGIESEVPAIVLVIPSCFQQIDKLKEQIKVNSSIAAKRLRSHLIQFLSAAISQTQSKDMVNEAADILKGADFKFLQQPFHFI